MEGEFRKHGQKGFSETMTFENAAEWSQREKDAQPQEKNPVCRKEQVHRPYGWNVHGRTEEQGDQCYWIGGRAGRAWRHQMGEVARDLSQKADAAWQGSRDLTPRVMRGFLESWEQEVVWFDLQFRRKTLAVLWRRESLRHGFLLATAVSRQEMKVAWTRMTVVVARSTLESGSIDFCRKNPDRNFVCVCVCVDGT